ncbi:MAG: spondin domain-containing protein [Phycisphaerales bacterium]
MRHFLVAAASLPLIANAAAQAETATYRLTVDTTWSTTTHPGLFPPDAHLSWIGGATHGADHHFWRIGELASPGVVRMAETGVTTTLIGEVNSAIAGGSAGNALDWRWWFCPDETNHPSCGEHVVEFDISLDHPRVSLVTMLGPSPDWFVGVDSLPLHDGTSWIPDLVVDLHPYDGGTRDANVFQLFGPETTPPDPITLITEASGQIIGPASLGTLRFELVMPPCPGDVDGDHAVTFTDVLATLSTWGPCPGCPADADGDGVVGFSDVLNVLSNFGPCP